MNKICQSCAMPLDQDPRGGGTEEDGSSSADYCSFCYQNGRFTNGITDPREMRAYVREKLIDCGFSSLHAWFLALKVPYLKRWRK